MVTMPAKRSLAGALSGAVGLWAALAGCSEQAPSSGSAPMSSTDRGGGGGSGGTTASATAGAPTAGAANAGTTMSGAAGSGASAGLPGHAGAGQAGHASCPYPNSDARDASRDAAVGGASASAAFSSLDWTSNAYSDHEHGPPSATAGAPSTATHACRALARPRPASCSRAAGSTRR
jgi:hypothetical protein